MIRMVILVCFVACLHAQARAEVIYCKDGQILKGTLVDDTVKIKTLGGQLDISKDAIDRIDFSDVINNDAISPLSFPDKETKEDFEEYMAIKRRNKRRQEARAKSMFSIGHGAGLPYGYLGFNGQLLLRGHVGLTAGIDASTNRLMTYGLKYYFGDKGDKFRLRLSGLTGDVGFVDVYSWTGKETIKIPGKAAYVGFQWKMATILSLDVDLGYAMADSQKVSYVQRWYTSYYDPNLRRYIYDYQYYTQYATVTDAVVASIGLGWHF